MEKLEVVISKNPTQQNPFSVQSFISYYNISNLEFMAQLVSLFLKKDYNLTMEEIVAFPYQFKDLNTDDIDLFYSKLNLFINRK